MPRNFFTLRSTATDRPAGGSEAETKSQNIIYLCSASDMQYTSNHLTHSSHRDGTNSPSYKLSQKTVLPNKSRGSSGRNANKRSMCTKAAAASVWHSLVTAWTCFSNRTSMKPAHRLEVTNLFLPCMVRKSNGNSWAAPGSVSDKTYKACNMPFCGNNFGRSFSRSRKGPTNLCKSG